MGAGALKHASPWAHSHRAATIGGQSRLIFYRDRPAIPLPGIAMAALLGVGALAADLPDPELTPGKTRNALVEEICTAGSVRAARPAMTTLNSRALRQEVYRRYGLAGNCRGYCAGPEGCELDHLVPLELGGSNEIENLWPQPYAGTPWNAHVKDRLENRLHELVCAGRLPLDAAQRAIAADWIAAYRKYIGNEPSPVGGHHDVCHAK